VDYPRRSWLAAMGRMDRPPLSVGCARSPAKSLVLLWLSTGRGRNAQRATVIRHAFFYFLAIVSEKMDSSVAHASRFRGDGGVDSCAVAALQSSSVDCRCTCGRPQLAIPSRKRVAGRWSLGRRYHRMRSLSHWCLGWRQLRVVANWFYLRQRTLPLPFHQFVLQPPVPSVQSWLVAEGSLLVG